MRMIIGFVIGVLVSTLVLNGGVRFGVFVSPDTVKKAFSHK